MNSPTTTADLPAPLLVADHPALDLLNTRMMVDGSRRDLLTSDEQARQWLAQLDAADGADLAATADDGQLLAQLRALRDAIEALVKARLENRAADPSALNAFLRNAVPQLVWDTAGTPSLERFSEPNAATRRLSEIALAAAQLLAEGDMTLVRTCESPDCTLMFYDRTKSHKRRWCSMALCGNRHKVAEFRKRRQGGGA